MKSCREGCGQWSRVECAPSAVFDGTLRICISQELFKKADSACSAKSSPICSCARHTEVSACPGRAVCSKVCTSCMSLWLLEISEGHDSVWFVSVSSSPKWNSEPFRWFPNEFCSGNLIFWEIEYVWDRRKKDYENIWKTPRSYTLVIHFRWNSRLASGSLSAEMSWSFPTIIKKKVLPI